MSAKSKPTGPRVDTRGLPEGMDPHYFYEYRTLARSQEATGLEGFLYALLPYNLIRSFAIAIDPLSNYKTSQGVITPVNRKRVKTMASVLGNRMIHYFRYAKHFESIHNYMGVGGAVGPVKYDPDTILDNRLDGAQYVQQQPILEQYSSDSTRRTRLLGSDIGEFEMFKHQIFSPGRNIYKQDTSVSDFITPNPSPPSVGTEWYGGGEYIAHQIIGQSAILSRDTYNYHLANEKTSADAFMSSEGLGMLKNITPQSRDYSLFRNIIELRDVPRTILQLRTTLQNLRSQELVLDLSKLSLKFKKKIFSLTTALDDIPSEYLAYHFGWKQTYSDTLGLLRSPGRIAKKINLLIERNGKPTTYRTKRNFVLSDTGIPGFGDYVVPYGESQDGSVQHRLDREIELRMMVNTTFTFPNVDLPDFVEQQFIDQLGIYPRATDIYNLVPWTWLIDWFSGLGNYVEIIDNINHDRSLINYGFLTYESKGKVTSILNTHVENNSTITHNNISTHTVNKVYSSHSSVWEYTFQRRKDLAGILDVNATSDPTSLTPYQNSILGALLTQRTSFKRL